MNLKSRIFFICFIGISVNLKAQVTLKATLIDSISNRPVPFATISFNQKMGVLSNEDGNFQLHINRKTNQNDSLHISCLGYETKQLAALRLTFNTIRLMPKVIELNEVFLSNKKYTVDEIIAKVTDNLTSNYESSYTKRRFFFRETFYQNGIKRKVELKKSSIPEFNQQFLDKILNDIPRQSDYYIEILGDLYCNEYPNNQQKLKILKACKLYDKADEITLDAIEEKLNVIAKKHIKKNSYFKIKSGIFGFKIDSTAINNSEGSIQKDSLAVEQNVETKNITFFTNYKSAIHRLTKSTFIFGKFLNIIHKAKKYKFKLLDQISLNQEWVYKIAFEPKKRADYKGVIYVNTEDFAVVRMEYQNAKNLSSFKLLGVSRVRDLRKGILIYSKNTLDKYVLRYAELENGEKIGIKRPLKLIEKNKHVKGRRKQNEVAVKLDFKESILSKKELIFFEHQPITENDYTNYIENLENKEIIPEYLPNYDSKFWEGYHIIEPNQAIRDFKSVDTIQD